MTQEEWRTVALIAAGALFGFLPSAQLGDPLGLSYALVALTLALALTMLGTGLAGRFIHRFRAKSRQSTHPSFVGILNDAGKPVSETNSSWTEVTLQEWTNGLRTSTKESNSDAAARFTNVGKDWDGFSAVLNPYGESYPEEDLQNHPVLDKILRFVRDGGVFVNVAGIPAWYAYSRILGQKIQNADTVFSIGGQGLVAAEISTLAVKLSLKIVSVPRASTNLISTKATPSILIDYERVILLDRRMESLVAPTKVNGVDASPFVTLTYGRGLFVFSLFSLQAQSHIAGVQTIIDGICREIIRVLPTSPDANATVKPRRIIEDIPCLLLLAIPVMILTVTNLPQALFPTTNAIAINSLAASRSRAWGAISSIFVFDGWQNIAFLAVFSLIFLCFNLYSERGSLRTRLGIFASGVLIAAVLANMLWLFTPQSTGFQSSGTSGVTYASLGVVAGGGLFYFTTFVQEVHLYRRHIPSLLKKKDRRLRMPLFGPIFGVVSAIIVLTLGLSNSALFFSAIDPAVNWVVHLYSFMIAFVAFMVIGAVDLASRAYSYVSLKLFLEGSEPRQIAATLLVPSEPKAKDTQEVLERTRSPELDSKPT